MFARFAKKEKKSRRIKKSHRDSGDSSDSDSERNSSDGESRRPKRQKLNISIHQDGFEENEHPLNPVNEINNNSNLKDIYDEINRLTRDVNYLKNNLFVYNQSSFPTRLRKYVREQIEFSPEVVAVLLPDVRMANKNNNKKKIGIQIKIGF